MTVQIDKLSSEVDVIPDAAPPSGGSAPTESWQETHHLRAARTRLSHDERRTRAEGFDD